MTRPSDASSGFMMDAGMRLADKLRKKHHQDEGSEVGASGNPVNTPSFCAARNIACPSLSGETRACGTVAAGRVLSRTTSRRHECQ